MANTKHAAARLTLRFQMEPNKYITMLVNHVNPESDLAQVGDAIASVTQYHGYPYELRTSFG